MTTPKGPTTTSEHRKKWILQKKKEKNKSKNVYLSPPFIAPFSATGAPLLLRLWYEPMWQEGANVAEQRVRRLRPRPVGDRREHRLLALPGRGRHPSSQPEHRDAHVAPLWSVEGLLFGW